MKRFHKSVGIFSFRAFSAMFFFSAIGTKLMAQPVTLPTPYSSVVSSTAAGFQINNSSSGNALYGNSVSGAGVVASSTDASGAGLYASNSANGIGIWGVSTSGPAGVYGNGPSWGVLGISYGTSGNAIGIFGNNTTGANGYGVYGYSSSNIGLAAYSGLSGGQGILGTTNGSNSYGVEGYNNSSSGSGVYGYGPIGVYGFGTTSAPGVRTGIYGFADKQHSAAIYGQSVGASNNWAGYFVGNVAVNGSVNILSNFVSNTKQFIADHPVDPANKFLSHSSMESDEMKNLYDGIVMTDSAGKAVVTLPDWFEALNGDFQYHLTVIGKFARATIRKEISNGAFEIRTSKPSTKVSWQVTGRRHDPIAKAHPLIVESEKSPEQQNKFLDPVAYGHPETDSIYWAPQLPKQRLTERFRPPAPSSLPPDTVAK